MRGCMHARDRHGGLRALKTGTMFTMIATTGLDGGHDLGGNSTVT